MKKKTCGRSQKKCLMAGQGIVRRPKEKRGHRNWAEKASEKLEKNPKKP